jgi:hypothetical protein
MQLQNIQQTIKCVEVYYECLLKLTNYLRVRATNVFLAIVIKAGWLSYLRLTTTSMKRNILIEHKEAIIVCEESGHVSMSYNVLITTPEANVRVKFLILAMSTKSILTCTNCGNISHSMEACHNKKN